MWKRNHLLMTYTNQLQSSLKIQLHHFHGFKPQEEEKNAIQSLFAETPIAYKKCNETISSETASKSKYLLEIPENTCFKVQDTKNQIEFDRSVETSSTRITQPIPETIYAFRPKKANPELSNSSKMLFALFGEMESIKTMTNTENN